MQADLLSLGVATHVLADFSVATAHLDAQGRGDEDEIAKANMLVFYPSGEGDVRLRVYAEQEPDPELLAAGSGCIECHLRLPTGFLVSHDGTWVPQFDLPATSIQVSDSIVPPTHGVRLTPADYAVRALYLDYESAEEALLQESLGKHGYGEASSLAKLVLGSLQGASSLLGCVSFLVAVILVVAIFAEGGQGFVPTVRIVFVPIVASWAILLLVRFLVTKLPAVARLRAIQEAARSDAAAASLSRWGAHEHRPDALVVLRPVTAESGAPDLRGGAFGPVGPVS